MHRVLIVEPGVHDVHIGAEVTAGLVLACSTSSPDPVNIHLRDALEGDGDAVTDGAAEVGARLSVVHVGHPEGTVVISAPGFAAEVPHNGELILYLVPGGRWVAVDAVKTGHCGRDLLAPGSVTRAGTSIRGNSSLRPDTPFARPMCIVAHGNRPGPKGSATMVPLSALEVARAYGFPPGSGEGQTIGIVQLGGGYRPSDLALYFSKLGMPCPTVHTRVLPGSVGNNPSDTGASVEVALDMQIAGAIAPGAKLLIVFAPNTAAGFVAGVEAAASAADVVSVSWGAPESAWGPGDRARMAAVLASAAARGVNIFVASGDSGSSDGVPPQRPGAPAPAVADFPASSPSVIACGGTTLILSADSKQGTPVSETVWNSSRVQGASGGAFSSVFAKPVFQDAVVPGARRGVPDVCGCADPRTGYQIVVNGRVVVVGGTSAVAPLYAGLAARLQQRAGRSLPFLNPALYAAHGAATVDITQGTNGAFAAVPGWDAASGLGRVAFPGFETALHLDREP